MKLKLALILISSFFSVAKSWAISDSTAFKNWKPKAIWVNAGQLSREELIISYEHFFQPDLSFEFAVGYKKPRREGINYNVHLSRFVKDLNTFDYAERLPFSEGILVSGALRSYTDKDKLKRSRTYFSPQFFYRYRFYDSQLVTTYPAGSDERTPGVATLQSLDLNIYGGKFLIGRTIRLFGFNKTKNVLLDIYGGVGLRHKEAKTVYYWRGSEGHSPPATLTSPPETEHKSITLISFHLGCKLGFQF